MASEDIRNLYGLGDDGRTGLTEGGGYEGGPQWDPAEYNRARGIQSGRDRRNERRSGDAEAAARQEAINEWSDQQFFDAYGQDIYGGLRGFMPDYSPEQWGRTMGDSSQQADALGKGAAQFQDIYDQGGYTGLERAQIEQAQMQARQGEQSQRNAVQQQMQMRGMGGSGLEAMGAMGAQQAGANAGLQASTDVATQAQNRALGALSQGTQFAGQGGQAADAFNQAHLGWQGQQQRDRLADETAIRDREEEQRRYSMSSAQAMKQGDAPVDHTVQNAAINTAGNAARAVGEAYD